jgi:transposase
MIAANQPRLKKMQPTYEELFANNQALLTQNQALIKRLDEALAKINQLESKIKELEDKLNTNSSNSSKPPSQDPFRLFRKTKKTGRKQGAQPGHQGYRRQLYPPEQVQNFHDLKPNECPSCKSQEFCEDTICTDVRQVIELPDLPPEVTQYNIHTCQCSCCGKHVKAKVPHEAQYGFGPRLMGLVTMLSGEFRLSKRQVSVLCGKLGVRICTGSICKIHERVSRILIKPYEEVRLHTLSQNHLNADESSWKTMTQKRWIWIAHGKDSVFYSIKAARSSEAFREVYGEFAGGLTTDRYAGYNSHEGPQQLCWSHADRDFEKIATRGGVDKTIGNILLNCKTTVFNLWHKFKNGEIDRLELIKLIEEGSKKDTELAFKMSLIIEDVTSKTKATCLDFLNRYEKLWTFVYTEGVEPTNNLAERGLRHAVIWRNLSHGSQSENGERFVERVMTIAMTLKLQAGNTLDYFTECFKRFIFGLAAPPINLHPSGL